MTTTHLFVELLVIGFGTLLWIGLLAATILGYDISHLQSRLFSIEALFPLLSLAYVFGILTDRVADWTFDAIWDSGQRRRVYGDDEAAKKRYFDDRRLLVVQSPELWRFMEYGRSRLRICRGWVINSLGILLAGSLFLAVGNGLGPVTWRHYLVVVGSAAAIGILCWLSWARLNQKEYLKTERQAAWLRDQP